MDEVDLAQEINERHLEESLFIARQYTLAPGTPGDCDLCGEHSPRLVGGACAPSRDKYGLD